MIEFTANRGSPEENVFKWVIRWTEIIFMKTDCWCYDRFIISNHSIRWIKIHFQINIHVSIKMSVLCKIRGKFSKSMISEFKRTKYTFNFLNDLESSISLIFSCIQSKKVKTLIQIHSGKENFPKMDATIENNLWPKINQRNGGTFVNRNGYIGVSKWSKSSPEFNSSHFMKPSTWLSWFFVKIRFSKTFYGADWNLKSGF